jgi:hypothetical protein
MLFRRLAMMILAVCLAACTLSTQKPTEEPTATAFVPPTARPTQTANPTLTPLPTSAPIPTATVRPLPNVNQPVPALPCGLVSTAPAVNIRSGPGTNYPAVGILPAGHYVYATRLSDAGWFQISYSNPAINGGWISNTVVSLQPPCVCTAALCSVQSPTLPPPATQPPPPPTQGPPPDQCSVSALNPGTQVAVFNTPTTDNGSSGVLGYGDWRPVVGRSADGLWYAIDPGVAQGPNVGIYRLRWVQSGMPINLMGAPCGTLKTVNLNLPPTSGQCLVTPVNISSVPIYVQSGFDAGTVGQLPSGATAVVVGQTPANWYGSPGGWYAIDPGTPQAPAVGKYRLRWIPVNNNVQLTGSCSDISVVTLDPF